MIEKRAHKYSSAKMCEELELARGGAQRCDFGGSAARSEQQSCPIEANRESFDGAASCSRSRLWRVKISNIFTAEGRDHQGSCHSLPM